MTNTTSYLLQVVTATATSLDGKWQLDFNLPSPPDPFDSLLSLEKFIQSLHLKPGHELVLFMRIFVTEKMNFLVIGNKEIPERNLLRSVLNVEGDRERRIFFFTANVSTEVEKSDKASHEVNDYRNMRGVTLYRLNSKSTDVPITDIEIAAGITFGSVKPKTALEFYKTLNSGNNILVSGVPSGTMSATKCPQTDYTKTDFALLLTYNEPSSKYDEECFNRFCSNVKNLRHWNSREGDFTKVRVQVYVKEFSTKVEKNIKEKPESVGKIWVFVSMHGNDDGLVIGSECISLEELTKPLFEGQLADKTKVLIIDACRGEWPVDSNGSQNRAVSQEDSTENRSKCGLMFRNAFGADPWSVGDMPRCLTLFGALPGFKSYHVPDKGSILFKAMKNAAKSLRSAGTTEELHEFVQRIQHHVIKLQNRPTKSPETQETPREMQDLSLENSHSPGVTVIELGQLPLEAVIPADDSNLTQSNWDEEVNLASGGGSSGGSAGSAQYVVQSQWAMRHEATSQPEIIQPKEKKINATHDGSEK